MVEEVVGIVMEVEVVIMVEDMVVEMEMEGGEVVEVVG